MMVKGRAIMHYKDMNKDQIQEVAMVELAATLLEETQQAFEYHDLLKKVGDIKGYSEEDLMQRISNLYTDMSLDGRFVNLGNARWGLRSWYPFDQTEEELSAEASKERKRRAKERQEEEDLFDDEAEDFDEFEDLEDELDDLANEEDAGDYDELDDTPDSSYPADELNDESEFEDEEEK
ncbi:DNA-directed RNA polymerase delta subunit [Salisediminibacterium beveridgei]|uniref:Probable DNA-directed RNA polymerase subunit delta n=2 Tax=Salisediminibacterium beveridgei TaxID=632773 RepID=A0A1D7QRB4_9BACI|nr:DNA-directed RNA polymerase delta subunit [Salisediminibacterium beveridgei]